MKGGQNLNCSKSDHMKLAGCQYKVKVICHCPNFQMISFSSVQERLAGRVNFILINALLFCQFKCRWDTRRGISKGERGGGVSWAWTPPPPPTHTHAHTHTHTHKYKNKRKTNKQKSHQFCIFWQNLVGFIDEPPPPPRYVGRPLDTHLIKLCSTVHRATMSWPFECGLI